jgi:putative tricarboxylic transport membrane protein
MMRESGSGAVGVLIGIAVIAEALRLEVGTPTSPQPGFFPFLGGAALVMLSAILLVQARLGRSEGGETFGEVRRPAILVGGLAVYVTVLDPAGYLAATIILTGVILWVLGVRSWRILCVGSLAIATGTYVLFAHLLGVDLPPGLLQGRG